MKQGADIRQGTLRPMVLNALDVLGPLHGYTIAQYAEQISEALLAVNQGTLYPVLLRLEQRRERGGAGNGARFCCLTRTGQSCSRLRTGIARKLRQSSRGSSKSKRRISNEIPEADADTSSEFRHAAS